jgi:hypothetical protein
MRMLETSATISIGAMPTSSSHIGAGQMSLSTHIFFALMLEPFPLAARRFRSSLIALSGAGAGTCTKM